MLSWKVAPGNHKAAAKAFLRSGAPAPKGLTLLGRWHGPGSICGWTLVEGEDAKALAEHVAEWAGLVEFQITPVIEDTAAGQVLSRAYA